MYLRTRKVAEDGAKIRASEEGFFNQVSRDLNPNPFVMGRFYS
jgi:hypothetical protein